MTRRTIGIVDYGVGNHASVAASLRRLGYRCKVSHEPEVLSAADLLVLPGVGAFPAAMAALHQYGLVDWLREHARAGRPLIGLCLGMQLFADHSTENGETVGLGLIPGHVEASPTMGWHIGWNSLDVAGGDPLLAPSDGELVYFNHSYYFRAPAEYSVALARHGEPFVAAVRRGRVLGFQFHPEKSQSAGHELLRNAVEGLCA